MKKNNTPKGPRGAQPSKSKKKTAARKTVDVLNPNVNGQAVKRQNQAARVAAKGEVLQTGSKSRGVKKTSKLMAWADLVGQPFQGVSDVKCPLNFNPAPSLLSTRVTLMNSTTSFKVTAQYMRQLTFWPGHNVLCSPPVGVGAASAVGTGVASLGDFDEVAYHCKFQSVAGGNYAVGPMNSPGGALTTRVAIPGVFSADSSIGTGGVIGTTAAGGVFVWDNPLPVIADPTKSGHSRWKMIAMGLRIRNVTPVSLRGGSIVSVQPANVLNLVTGGYTLQNQFDKDPSFRIWGDGTEEVEICWTPRTRDLAYWHMSTANIAGTGTDYTDTTIEGPALLIWLNAATGTDQYYTFEQFAHFEISGTHLQLFSNQTHSMSTPVAPVQQALGSHVNSSPTAAGIAHTIAAATGDAVSSAGKSAAAALGSVAKAGFQTAVAAVRNSM